jgi:hypothetical protein
MKIDKIIFHGIEQMDERRAATILLTDGARLNAWYYPGSYALSHVNSLPRDPNYGTSKGFYLYRKRNLQCAHGRKLAADFKEYAQKHERAAIKAIEEEKVRKEQERLAAVAEQQEERANAAAQVVASACRFIACGGISNARTVVNALIDAGFIDRNG